MKFVAIMGTNREGKTLAVVRAIETRLMQKAKSQGMESPSFTYIFLKNEDIRTCTGCHQCIFTGEARCPLKNDAVADIVSRMEAADAVVFASPGYMMNVTGIMKQFLDRVAYNCHRPRFFRQKALLVANSSQWATKETIKAMESFAGGSGFEIAGRLTTSYLPIPMRPEAVAKEDAKVEQMADHLWDKLCTRAPRPPIGLGDLMQFAAMKHLSDKFPARCSADHAFFSKICATGLRHWYVPVRIKPAALLMKTLMMPFVKSSMNKMFLYEET